jgi:hypothetical protein
VCLRGLLSLLESVFHERLPFLESSLALPRSDGVTCNVALQTLPIFPLWKSHLEGIGIKRFWTISSEPDRGRVDGGEQRAMRISGNFEFVDARAKSTRDHASIRQAR